MRKLLLSAVCVFAVVFSVHGQKPAVVSNHSVSLHLMGLGYAYEHSFGGSFTLQTTISLNAVFLSDPGFRPEDSFSYTIRPSIELQPRYYYNFARRADKGRNTNLNSANYVAVQVIYGFPTITNNNTRLVSVMNICPIWGLRRVWTDRWLFEFWAGPGFSTAFEANDPGATLELEFIVTLGVKFGYVF